jgi:hypothetical protein
VGNPRPLPTHLGEGERLGVIPTNKFQQIIKSIFRNISLTLAHTLEIDENVGIIHPFISGNKILKRHPRLGFDPTASYKILSVNNQ